MVANVAAVMDGGKRRGRRSRGAGRKSRKSPVVKRRGSKRCSGSKRRSGSKKRRGSKRRSGSKKRRGSKRRSGKRRSGKRRTRKVLGLFGL